MQRIGESPSYSSDAVVGHTRDGVRLESLVYVDLDAGVSTGVRAREADSGGLRASTTSNLKLSTLHLRDHVSDGTIFSAAIATLT